MLYGCKTQLDHNQSRSSDAKIEYAWRDYSYRPLKVRKKLDFCGPVQSSRYRVRRKRVLVKVLTRIHNPHRMNTFVLEVRGVDRVETLQSQQNRFLAYKPFLSPVTYLIELRLGCNIRKSAPPIEGNW